MQSNVRIEAHGGVLRAAGRPRRRPIGLVSPSGS
jgi:hypothetical protein